MNSNFKSNYHNFTNKGTCTMNNNFGRSYRNFNNKGNFNMNNKYFDASFDLNNPAPRCPVILLLDTSYSMDGQPIRELNAGLRQFIDETSHDEAASMSVELEVITFDNKASIAMPFTTICDVEKNPAPLIAGGITAMGAALNLAEKELSQRRIMYKNAGISSYRPWVILMTDGGPNDEWEKPAEKMRRLAEAGKITYIGIEIGDSADHCTMCQILPAAPGPVPLQGLKFKQFFRWLTDSLRSVSASAVSDQDNVMYGDISSWAELSKMSI